MFGVMQSEYLMNECLSSMVIHEIKKKKSSPAPHHKKLDETDRAILKLLSEGFRHKQIATRLKMKDRTLESHIEKLRKEYDCKNSAELAANASRLLSEDEEGKIN